VAKVRSANREKRARQTPDSSASLRKHLVELLKGGEAHVGISDTLADFPADKRATAAQGLPHTAWQLLEHIRIAQWDILEFSRNPKHVSPDFPDGYWPKVSASPDDGAWRKSVHAVQNDLRAMVDLVSDPRVDLYATFPWGDGQTLLREALLLADHNAYHAGQMVDLRRALGIWKK
jgi:hypothetical protein